ncbi:outer-membrane lipoprotein carrier protein LolA [Bosea sp. BIWAKO-01]|uniref:LolA family protein n=1 Tax=Bosea sp. BIWAKO-01 TaxID=506668 RepID=UPI000852AEA9|nr:outer-membrane lipoprotein carrier protein LolA [Bosea sp. BIWAKO-01]GAU82215.1 outer membrane lipoprotein carrier protein LolA [Bosea sp. BIWAKO-01]
MTRVSPMQASLGAFVALGLAIASGPLAAQPLDLQAKPAAPAAKPAAPRAIPLPPMRPPGLGLPRTAEAASAPVVTTVAAEQPRLAAVPVKSTTSKHSAPLTQQEAVERLNAYFNGFATLQGDFIQFASDGRRFEGKLYIQRPGKMRFEYRPPVTMEVIADGTSVAIRDKKLATQDLYSIGQTPLKFLVKERMDLARDSTITKVSTKGDILSVSVEDRSTLGGTSKITLNYDMAANELRQWVVIDPQGYETSVSLYNLDTQRRPDPKNFVINYERML